METFWRFWRNARNWVCWPDIRGETRFIIVMGMTGSGKTTFISQLTDQKAEIRVGHSLASSTAETSRYRVSGLKGEDIYLVDTPGFDDTKQSDLDILRTITDELAQLWHFKKCLVGVIFLHRITDVRLTSSAVKNMTVLQKLCGSENYGRIALATTMWKMAPGEEEEEAAEQRQNELEEYWKEMFGERSLIMRHKANTRESALEVVQGLRGRVQDTDTQRSLQIQRELCDEERKLEDTDAGHYVHFGLLKPVEQREMAELQKKIKDEGTRLGETELEAKKSEVRPGLKVQEFAGKEKARAGA
ncbi:P-loop containing nucleoside triphosphate hydrolase protein [Lasiosphaeria hispida]|uniref:P-loop containing nucleoside triphosphate hydrolase protein n=1 Tax=Lasiosphaeria hispida TaxID=260671 RepID=A0AAJ0HPE4_9PEZI|nr:P-loop containing nucleoside triphosphate hydrolase protein [Lasiosphaeria hispida]